MADNPTRQTLALVVGGGPAPGINGVISAATIEAINRGLKVIGVQDGYKWLVEGRLDKTRELSINEVVKIYNDGGSILGTSRTNPAEKDAYMNKVLESFRQLGVTHLVSI